MKNGYIKKEWLNLKNHKKNCTGFYFLSTKSILMLIKPDIKLLVDYSLWSPSESLL